MLWKVDVPSGAVGYHSKLCRDTNLAQTTAPPAETEPVASKPAVLEDAFGWGVRPGLELVDGDCEEEIKLGCPSSQQDGRLKNAALTKKKKKNQEK